MTKLKSPGIGGITVCPESKEARKKVLVAMSGGVDSSVAAALLKSQGHEVIGVHLQLWNQASDNFERVGSRCCSLSDSNDAKRVCDLLEIPYYVINAQDVFKEKVVDYFVHEYLQARTPNPCVECNNKIKFSFLFQKADELGCDSIATGHYAQVQRDIQTGQMKLLRGADPEKDQSYFLYGLKQKGLERVLMPIGGLSKPMVRKLAAGFGLELADKADSQDICFVDNKGYANFIEKNVAADLRPGGVIQREDGSVLGTHDGMFRYTVGQKKGLNINKQFSHQEFAVLGFDAKHNAMVVGSEDRLLQKKLIAEYVNWIRPVRGLSDIQCKAKIRARHQEAEAMVSVFENQTVRVEFKDPQRAISPGQSIVFYEDDEVLGGGSIAKVGFPAA